MHAGRAAPACRLHMLSNESIQQHQTLHVLGTHRVVVGLEGGSGGAAGAGGGTQDGVQHALQVGDRVMLVCRDARRESRVGRGSTGAQQWAPPVQLTAVGSCNREQYSCGGGNNEAGRKGQVAARWHAELASANEESQWKLDSRERREPKNLGPPAGSSAAAAQRSLVSCKRECWLPSLHH